MSSRSQHACNFTFSDGRRCRMLRHRHHPELCPSHAREEQQLADSQQLGRELSTTLTGHFYTATDINHVLGKVFSALAQKRIGRRDAATLAYTCQLMLLTLPRLKSEFSFKYSYDSWSNMIDSATHLSPPQSLNSYCKALTASTSSANDASAQFADAHLSSSDTSVRANSGISAKEDSAAFSAAHLRSSRSGPQPVRSTSALNENASAMRADANLSRPGASPRANSGAHTTAPLPERAAGFAVEVANSILSDLAGSGRSDVQRSNVPTILFGADGATHTGCAQKTARANSTSERSDVQRPDIETQKEEPRLVTS
jgi:hypothetical protein